MSIITKNKLSSVTDLKLGSYSFNNILSESKNQNRNTSQTTVFLSHSHEDLKDGTVNRAIVFLRKLGVVVYIDSNDSSLPPTTNAQTAKIIKDKIKNSDKFILLATNNSIISKWCNWELGYGDAYKYINKIALFPIAENEGTWLGNEYLRIYPRIEESNILTDYYKVIFPDGTEKTIANWLTS